MAGGAAHIAAHADRRDHRDLHYPLTSVRGGHPFTLRTDHASRGEAPGACAMTIDLYNSRTRTKEPFAPLDPSNVRMYVCGPTVYDRAHIGNARPVVVFDVLYRLLRHTYGAEHVTYVRNITDVDDKIIARAQATLQPGETLEAATRRITDETIGWYHDDMDALGALRADARAALHRVHPADGRDDPRPDRQGRGL